MAILLDRDGNDTEFQEWMQILKKNFYVDTENKGDAKAIRKLVEWYVNKHTKDTKRMSDELERLWVEEREHKRLIENLKLFKNFLFAIK